VFAKQRKGKSIYDFGNFFDNLINRKFFILQKFIGHTRGTPKTASAGERPVSFLGSERRPRRTQGISSAQAAAAVRA
jgi:hypothetical protein